MGTVWSATHLLTGREVAIKFVRGRHQSRSEVRQRFLREVRAATAVGHPNVISVIDAFELDDDSWVMVMELLEGETLRERLEREEQLSLESTAEILLAAVSAVGTAHARGVVHRDLKPENVFLARMDDGTTVIKVLDFGIAKLAGASAEHAGLITQEGRTLGTPCYMAPEQATGASDLDYRVDIWALGVILYECLSGLRPIEGESIGQVVMRLMSTGIIPLERLVLDLPEDVTRLVGRMLSRERSKRPADLRDVAAVLRRHTEVAAPPFGAPGSEAQAPAPELLARGEPVSERSRTPGRTGNRRRAGIAALVGGTALVVGGAIWFAPTRAVEPDGNVAASVPVSPAPQPTFQNRSADRQERRLPPAASAATTKPHPRPIARRKPHARPSTPAPAVSLRGLAETPPF